MDKLSFKKLANNSRNTIYFLVKKYLCCFNIYKIQDISFIVKHQFKLDIEYVDVDVRTYIHSNAFGITQSSILISWIHYMTYEPT